MSSDTILVADQRAAFEAFRRALTAPLDLAPVEGLAEAREWLRQHPPPALVVCGCHFDEGGMYDLLRHLKAEPPLAHVPFLAVRCLQGELDDTLYESVKIAVRALGGSAFVDLPRWQGRYGEAEAGHRLTQLIDRLARAVDRDTG